MSPALSQQQVARIDRCRREIAEIEANLMAGLPNIEGMVLGLMDWCHEIQLIEQEARQS
jgi:hypothetical protein